LLTTCIYHCSCLKQGYNKVLKKKVNMLFYKVTQGQWISKSVGGKHMDAKENTLS